MPFSCDNLLLFQQVYHVSFSKYSNVMGLLAKVVAANRVKEGKLTTAIFGLTKRRFCKTKRDFTAKKYKSC